MSIGKKKKRMKVKFKKITEKSENELKQFTSSRE